MTDRLEKLEEFSRAWIDADRNYSTDCAAAHGDQALIQTIDANWWRHQANWSMAATAALEKNSSEIAGALADAKAANDAIEAGRRSAERITRIVRSSSAAASALAKLLQAVAKT